MMIEDCNVNVTGGELEEKEIAAYVARGREKYGARMKGINIHVDGDYVDLTYDIGRVPFQRIRRITGYLVGTMDRWNDSKQAEEADRVKHSVG